MSRCPTQPIVRWNQIFGGNLKPHREPPEWFRRYILQYYKHDRRSRKCSHVPHGEIGSVSFEMSRHCSFEWWHFAGGKMMLLMSLWTANMFTSFKVYSLYIIENRTKKNVMDEVRADVEALEKLAIFIDRKRRNFCWAQGTGNIQVQVLREIDHIYIFIL